MQELSAKKSSLEERQGRGATERKEKEKGVPEGGKICPKLGLGPHGVDFGHRLHDFRLYRGKPSNDREEAPTKHLGWPGAIACRRRHKLVKIGYAVENGDDWQVEGRRPRTHAARRSPPLDIRAAEYGTKNAAEHTTAAAHRKPQGVGHGKIELDAVALGNNSGKHPSFGVAERRGVAVNQRKVVELFDWRHNSDTWPRHGGPRGNKEPSRG